MLLPREMDQYFLEVTEYLPSMNNVDVSYYLCLITKYKQLPSNNNTLVFLIKFLEKTQPDYIEVALESFNDVIITSNEDKVKKILFTEEMTQPQNICAYTWMFGKVFIKCLCDDSLHAISLLDSLSEQHSSYLEQLYQDTFTPEMKEIAKNNSKVFYKFKILDLFESQQYDSLFKEINCKDIPYNASKSAKSAFINYLANLDNKTKAIIFNYENEEIMKFINKYYLFWENNGNININEQDTIITVYNGNLHTIQEQQHNVHDLDQKILINYFVTLFKLCDKPTR